MAISYQHHPLKGTLHMVKVDGPLIGKEAEELTQLFQDLAQQDIKHLIVSLKDVPFVDSRGLAALVTGYKIFGSQTRNFQLAGLQSQPQLLLELTMFNKIFDIVDNVDGFITSQQHSLA